MLLSSTISAIKVARLNFSEKWWKRYRQEHFGELRQVTRIRPCPFVRIRTLFKMLEMNLRFMRNILNLCGVFIALFDKYPFLSRIIWCLRFHFSRLLNIEYFRILYSKIDILAHHCACVIRHRNENER